jgi:hypothetical protein
MTQVPFFTKISAVAFPMPDAEPVMTTVQVIQTSFAGNKKMIFLKALYQRRVCSRAQRCQGGLRFVR